MKFNSEPLRKRRMMTKTVLKLFFALLQMCLQTMSTILKHFHAFSKQINNNKIKHFLIYVCFAQVLITDNAAISSDSLSRNFEHFKSKKISCLEFDLLQVKFLEIKWIKNILSLIKRNQFRLLSHDHAHVQKVQKKLKWLDNQPWRRYPAFFVHLCDIDLYSFVPPCRGEKHCNEVIYGDYAAASPACLSERIRMTWIHSAWADLVTPRIPSICSEGSVRKIKKIF